MLQNSFAMPNPSQRWHTLTWLLMVSFLFASFSLNPVSSSRTQYSYYDHCASTVPGSSATPDRLANFPVARSYDGYYTGGGPVLDPDPYSYASTFSNSVLLRTLAIYKTDIPGLFKFEGRLTFPSANKYNYEEDLSYGRQSSYSYSYYGRPQRSSISFELQGYWSQSNGKLCTVGSASARTKEGNLVNIGAVLKLNNLASSSSITSLITGTLENLSSAKGADNFDPVSIMLLPQMNYEYPSVSEDHKNGCSGGSEIPPGLSLSSLPKGTFCSIASRAVNQFNLRYGRDCNSAKNCNPFDAGIGYVPRVMSLHGFECSEDKERMRVLVEFPNGTYVNYYRSFNAQTTLVGEGSWDESKHQLCIVACRFLGVTESLASARVGDCSTKLTLRFPAIWSIKDASSIVGQIWTNKTEKESGYFDPIMLRSSSRSSPAVGVADSKYKYTKIDHARKLCPKPEKPAKTHGERYPNGNSDFMRFDISVKNSKGQIAWGYSVPLSVGDQNFEYSSSQGSVEPSNSSSGSVNISYKIGLTPFGRISPFNTSSVSYETIEILAEGTYHAETGSLCMVGCRNLASDNQIPSGDSLDCRILVKLHFPPVNSKKASYIKGSINSTRERSDPLYFERLDLSSASFYDDGFSIWRMDVEIIMVLISTTLSCVFVVLQIFHVKRHPDVLPFVSLVMLSVLTLGHLIPLVLNFEALFFDYPLRRNRWFGSGGWVEANEVIVRVAGMVAFLFQFRLLQKTWSAKWGDGNKKGLCSAEKKTLFVALTLYVAGAMVAVVGSCWNSNDDGGMGANSPTILQSGSLWGHLKSYAGLVLDGFLLPQILLNISWNSRQKTLSCSFYIGNTFVRLLPHAYDLYRAHNFARHYDGSYIYASPGADFYSTAWDVVIPLGCLLFAMIVYLQQRFGGRCFFPRRFRELPVYEAVPVVCDA